MSALRPLSIDIAAMHLRVELVVKTSPTRQPAYNFVREAQTLARLNHSNNEPANALRAVDF
jgi:hypothetical protein